jgi:hypothetical protein
MSVSKAPFTAVIDAPIGADGATATLTSPIGVAPFDGTVTAVEYIPTATLTGADTNSRTISLFNRGQTGAGAVSVASKAFTAGVNAPANDSTAITLSGTPANLAVVAGDVLDVESLAVGGSGLAQPGGIIRVSISRS